MISITTKTKQFYNFTTSDRETTRNETEKEYECINRFD